MDRETNHNVNKEKDKVCIIYIKKNHPDTCAPFHLIVAEHTLLYSTHGTGSA